jgi:hypothetical protein
MTQLLKEEILNNIKSIEDAVSKDFKPMSEKVMSFFKKADELIRSENGDITFIGSAVLATISSGSMAAYGGSEILSGATPSVSFSNVASMAAVAVSLVAARYVLPVVASSFASHYQKETIKHYLDRDSGVSARFADAIKAINPDLPPVEQRVVLSAARDAIIEKFKLAIDFDESKKLDSGSAIRLGLMMDRSASKLLEARENFIKKHQSTEQSFSR